ncbi:UPF0187 protein At3g61320, chloroplastic [Dendrobium catenatum]|uniref:UPF0187 protein n=1 Tax=Dendrobium catenatum TaxID=906689 RepID=A0A2I0WX65_9ASPA|nr:UPF0187 protein At3g61320, chloroplastic [Dendrobium catenatum]PKU80237.1 UPF0187 protein [Dendrobium catenatum]
MEIKISSSSHFTPRFPVRLRRRTPLVLPNLSRRILSAKTSDPPIPSFPLSIRAIPDWADAIQERGVQKRRSLYTPEDWRAHRSSLRHLRHLLSSLSSRVILSLVPPVSVFTSFAAALAVYNSAVAHRWLPELFPLLHASSLPYQLTAPALALLLVFRTEASYSRFVEGRKVWMSVVAGASEMAGIVISSMARGRSGAEEAGIKRTLLNYIMAFPVALKCHVIGGSDIKLDLKNLLEEDDLAVICHSKHRPRCVIEFIIQSLQMVAMEESKRNTLESKISCFYDGISVCEQIIGIPIPLSYTRLTSRFLVLWHLSLPIILWDDCNWIVVPATFISAASLFCIEEVGVLIEEPFPMLALDELCKQLNESILEAIKMQRSVYARLTAKLKGHHGAHSINGRLNS